VKNHSDKIIGAILGTAVGDAVGLPREGLSRRRAERLFGNPPLRHRFVLGRGMISDDTEHTCMVAQALLASGGDADRFARSFAWRLRAWLLGVPAGIGFGTLRAGIKLWLGFSPKNSGVYSAGNGPAMRAAILGVFAADEPDRLRALVKASTRITHSDPQAEQGALAVALTARHGALQLHTSLLNELRDEIDDDALRTVFDKIDTHLQQKSSVATFAEAMGWKNGVTGYVVHSVGAALYGTLRHPTDFRRAVEEVICLGGDADTIGAIAGGLTGARLGADAIPQEWLAGIVEYPRTVAWMRRLGERVAIQALQMDDPIGAETLFWPGLLLRNPLFIVFVLLHGFRRLLPPY
jgi:ADP-ribosyl-[dinitrogen reductase] hydrolase